MTLKLTSVILATAILAGASLSQEDGFQRDVNKAIDQGVQLLRKEQGADGSYGGQFSLGMTALCGWAMLEGGVAKKDPAMEKLVNHLREECLGADHTYSISLAIIFFDRLGDPADEPFIEALACQLLGAVRRSIGWGYECPKLDKEDREFFQERAKKARDNPAAAEGDKEKDKKAKRILSKEALRLLQKLRALEDPGQTADNSNTQFAMMALWVARRHGAPVDQTLLEVERLFRRTQFEHGWTYTSDTDPKSFANPLDVETRSAMTCAGVLAYALGQGVKKEKKVKDLLKDPGVQTGLKAITKFMDKMGENLGGKDYYFLWSLERMAVVYDLTKVGERDWYKWGADRLIADQRRQGGWAGEYGIADTCFAILFLKRANVAQDLTKDLQLFIPIPKQPKK